MLDLVCTKPMRYNRRDLRPRQEFQAASENDARILLTLGKARERVIKAAPPPPVIDGPVDEPKTQRKKRRRRKRVVEPTE